jgi:methyl-accepting chemotaxis protein
MNALLSPGVVLLDRFKFARKFQLLFLLFMLPLAASLWLLGQDYVQRLGVIASERAGVVQLLALEPLNDQLLAQRDLTARWKASDTLRQMTPAASAAKQAFEAAGPAIQQSLTAVGTSLAGSASSAAAQKLYQGLQGAVANIDAASMGQVGWWPDGYERLTAALTALQALREQITLDSGLLLDPWLDTFLLMQIATTQTPDLGERVGRLASVGATSAASGQFSLQSRLQMRDLRARINDAREQLNKIGNSLMAHLADSMQPWARQYQQTQQRLDSELKVLDDGMFGSSITLATADFDRSVDALLTDLGGLRQQSLSTLDQRLAEYRAQSVGQFVLVFVGLTALLLAALYLFICLQASIRRSTQGITTLAQSLRDGNLVVQVAVHGRDELAAIGQALNLAVVQLRDSLLGVNHETLQLGDAVSTLNQQSQGTLGHVEAQQQQISQIAAAAPQLAATSQGVARSCEHASSSVRQTRATAEQSSRDSQQTTASIRQLNVRLTDTATALGQVSEQGQQIQSVVDSIRGIAEQTNLLALNAAIEAARAGEQGRGFAVVADEVRSLSQRTQSATAQIATTVESLRGTVRQAVDLMQAACGQAQHDAEAVTGLGDRLGEIATAVQSVSDTLSQIATAVDEQATTADEVSGNIQQVDQAAGLLLDGARAVNQAADRLSLGSRALSENTARFSLS